MRLKGLAAATNYSLADYTRCLAEHYAAEEVRRALLEPRRALQSLCASQTAPDGQAGKGGAAWVERAPTLQSAGPCSHAATHPLSLLIPLHLAAATLALSS